MTKTRYTSRMEAGSGYGTCPVCEHAIKVRGTDGKLRKHGGRTSRCSGSLCSPVKSETRSIKGKAL